MDQKFDWMQHLIDAARHSPQALAFVRTAMLKDEPNTYGPSWGTSTTAVRECAQSLNGIIFEQGLTYDIWFQCTPDSKPTFEFLLDILYKHCPHWRFHPTSVYRWTEIVDGVLDRDALDSRIDNQPRTQGGFRYERIDALVNRDAYAILKALCPALYLKNDFSDLIR